MIINERKYLYKVSVTLRNFNQSKRCEQIPVKFQNIMRYENVLGGSISALTVGRADRSM
jgi:hypothetical protein